MRSIFGYGGNLGAPPVRVAVYLVQRLYADGAPYDEPDWMLDGGAGWRAHDGERWNKRESDAVLETAEVLDGKWETLDWRRSSLLCSKSIVGWLSPDAEWFGCSMIWHEVVARLVFRCSPEELAQTFACVRDRDYARAPTGTGRFTAPQYAWLREHGHTLGSETEHEKREFARWEAASGRLLRRGGD